MTVRLVGEGPAIEGVAAALGDVDVRVERGGVDGLTDASLGVVSATAGDPVFERANGLLGSGGETAADEAGGRWIAIEVGGIGGVPLEEVDAAIAGFVPDGPCYRCLQQRVAANGPEPADAASADRSAVRMAGAIAGREIVRALAGEDRLSGRVIEVPHTERELLPVPNCDCENDSSGGRTAPGGPVPRTYEDRSLEETVSRMDRAIDPRVGIVAELGEAESFPAPYYLATLADTTGFSDGDAPRQAAGTADDWNAALAKGVGEALERYSGAIYRDETFRREAPAAVENGVPPAAFAGAGDDAPGAGSNRSIPWVRGEALTAVDGDHTGSTPDDSDVWLPAAAVNFPPPDPQVLPGITTGLGLESSGVGALVAGLTETIERDATMLAWYSTFEPLGLAVEDEAFDRLAKRAQSEGLTVTPLLVTQDVDVPVVSVAVHREDPWPRFAVGSAADLDPTAAARGALEEAVQNWMELRSIGPEQAMDREDAIGHFADLPDAARAFVDVEPAVPASEVGPAEPPEGEAALAALVAALEDAGLSAYAARLTTRDLEALGFEAVRVLVPDAQPLFTGTARFGDRAERVPASLGYEPRLDRQHHPYP